MARVLLVDDDKDIRELFSLELSEQGHEVISAASCRDLIKRIEISQAELVVLGMKRSDRAGMEMLNEIRSYCSDLPVIIWTAYDSYKFPSGTIAADYRVVKSYDLTKLKTMIQSALEAKDRILHRVVA